MREKTGNIKKSIMIFLILGVIFCIVYLRFASYKMSEDCIRIIDLSYKEGFISAGLIGTLYRGLNLIIPVELFDYERIYIFSKHMLMAYYVMAAFLVVTIYCKNRKLFKNNPSMVCLFVVFIAGMFGCMDSIGSFDMYQMIVVLFIMILLFLKKAEWLIVPAVLVGMMIHPSFIFKGFLIVASIMVYRWKIQKKDKFKILLICSLIVAGIVFIASEGSLFICILNDRALLAERVIREASSILPEWEYRGTNYLNLLIFLLFFSPYLLIGRDFFKRFYKKDIENVKVYRLLQLGALFILPEFILKIGYGFLIYSVIMYYVLLIMFMLSEEDKSVTECAEEEKEVITGIIPIPEVLVLYPLLLMPFYRISIMRGFDIISRLIGA